MNKAAVQVAIAIENTLLLNDLERSNIELSLASDATITGWSAARDIPHCPHEKWDGRGYPPGLKGEEIPIAARIFAIVDVYDALTSERPGRSKRLCNMFANYRAVTLTWLLWNCF